MLVAISGSQGSGKSTVLAALKELGNIVIERKSARSILSDWNVSLSEVNNNLDLQKKFQEEIIKRKISDEMEMVNNNPDKIVFTERTLADAFVYTIFACGKDNEYSEWVNAYYEQCLVGQKNYDYVFYLTGGLFNIQYDGVRGINYHYSKMVDLCMLEYTKNMGNANNVTIINTANHKERVELIIQKVGN